MAEQFLRRPTVEALTGKSTSVLYREMAAGLFPKPVKLGLRAVAWRASEIEEWQQSRIAERDCAA